MLPQTSRRFPAGIDLVDVLSKVGGGDETAFRELYEVTHVRVAQVVHRTLRAPEQSAEVVQDVFLYIWEHAGKFDPARGTVLGWMSMLAHRRAVDRVRQVTRSSARDHKEAARSMSSSPDAADLGLARLEAARIRAALHELTPRQREAIVLTFLHRHTNDQAASMLQIPLGTLKSRVRGGLIKLREHVAPLAA